MAQVNMLNNDDLPNQNMEAEAACLGSMLIEKRAVDIALELLAPEDFYRDTHRFIFEAMALLHGDDMPVDLITLQERLQAKGQFERVGGFLYLQNLMDAPSTAVNIDHYCRLVKECALRRSLQVLGMEIYQSAKAGETPVPELIESAEAKIYALRDDRARSAVEPFATTLYREIERIEEAYERKSAFTGLRTGFDEIDYLTGGMQAGDLIVLGARPSMGKSALMMQMATHIAKEGHNALVFSLEMSREQLVRRILTTEAKIDGGRMRSGYLSAEEWGSIGDASSRLWKMPLLIDDTSAITVSEIRSQARRMAATGRLGMILVDYLQLINHTKRDTETQEIGASTMALKNMAKEFKCPVVLISQLNRGVESRPNKRPNLSDIRGSGDVEAHADIILFLYRDAYYKQDKEPSSTGFEQAEVIVAKNRNGATGTAILGFFAPQATFVNQERYREVEEE